MGEDYDFLVAKFMEISCLSQFLFISDSICRDVGSTVKKFVALDYYRVKSLVKIIKKTYIGTKKVVAVASATRRCELLLRGYKKHSNMKTLR